ncbi:MAG TPA: hypothetical protein VJ249_03350 [Candidatus Bathyarchaeia archaeon]|nr:hypothetical protein [Candidatus Bathyarchaeia archaeon]
MSNTRMRLLGVFYIAEGVSFLAYSAWRLWIQPLEFYRAPPILELLAKIFMSLMFVAGVFYISRAPGIINGLFKSRSPDVAASVLSIPLWFFPALISLGNAATYLTSPYMPAELRPVGFYYVQSAFLFIVTGVFNVLGLYLSISLLRTRSSPRA